MSEIPKRFQSQKILACLAIIAFVWFVIVIIMAGSGNWHSSFTELLLACLALGGLSVVFAVLMLLAVQTSDAANTFIEVKPAQEIYLAPDAEDLKANIYSRNTPKA